MWEEHGFRMHIPEDALGCSDTCVIAIRAVVSGNFEFPEDTEPVSAIYGISTSVKFVKPITLEMQHCVVLKQKKDCRYLTFAVAHVQPDQPHLPCSFKKLKGGSFSLGSQYGIITCSSFSCFTILKRLFCCNSPSGSDSEDETGWLVGHKIIIKLNSLLITMRGAIASIKTLSTVSS